MACIFVNANRSVGTINPNIYGQFSEHLGRCIYQAAVPRSPYRHLELCGIAHKKQHEIGT